VTAARRESNVLVSIRSPPCDVGAAVPGFWCEPPDNQWPVSRANDLRAGKEVTYEPWAGTDGSRSRDHCLRMEDDGRDLPVGSNPATHEVAGGSA